MHLRATRVRSFAVLLGLVAAGDLSVRVPAGGSDEIGAALNAFNHMAGIARIARAAGEENCHN